MYYVYACLLTVAMKWYAFTKGLNLSPLGAIDVCPNGQISLNCVSNSSLLEWIMTVQDHIIGRRLVPSGEISDNIRSLSVNQTTFNFTLESRQPLNVTLSVLNVSVDMNIECQEFSPTNALTTAIHIIQVSLNDIQIHLSAPQLTVKEQSFQKSNVTLRLYLERIISTEISYDLLIHGVHVQFISDLAVDHEQITVDFFGNNATTELSISYNIRYNLTAFATLCGYTAQSETINLFYANCGIPKSPPNGYIHHYNISTLEGSEVNITCPQTQKFFTSICNSEGAWIPDTAAELEHCPNFTATESQRYSTSEIHTVTNDSSATAFGNNTSISDPIIIIAATVTSVASFVMLSLIFCGIMVIIALFRSQSCKHASTEELDTQPSPYYENTPSRAPYYENTGIPSPYYENINTIHPRVLEATHQDQEFELVDNICYGPLPLPVTATNI